jgi:hypothetical protein
LFGGYKFIKNFEEEDMRKNLLVFFGILFSVSILLMAQPQRPGRFYNPETVVTVSGEVQNVETRTFGPSGFGLIVLLLKTDKETISVNVGPEQYVSSQNFKFEKGDKIEVKGSKVEIRGENVILAAEIRKGDKVLKLRDENGMPLWGGPRR